jgi:starvation-inducible DNA-binding protein
MMHHLNIGLSNEALKGSIDLLNHDLADTSLLLIKTKKYHWDIVGPQFRSLHKMLDDQYEMLSESVDEIAERIRSLGGYPVGTAKGFLEIASIKEDPGDIPDATEMVKRLVADHEQIIRNLREHINITTDEIKDLGTADFLTDLIRAHEKIAWMLRSFIEGESIEPDHEKVHGEVRSWA